MFSTTVVTEFLSLFSIFSVIPFDYVLSCCPAILGVGLVMYSISRMTEDAKNQSKIDELYITFLAAYVRSMKV